MEETKEISALLHLIDDPDEEVFVTVCDRIVSFGKVIIPNLEHLWENTPNEEIQERIELLIHRLHFQDLQQEFTLWARADYPDLLQGALLVAKYQFPDINMHLVHTEIEKIRRNIWLELNSYLTALEQVNVVNKILFQYHKQKGVEISYQNTEEFLINKVLETHRGNSIANGVLYMVLCELLDLPVRVINIPRQFILGYFDNTHEYKKKKKKGTHKIHFYVDPMSGQVYTQKDVENYFKRIAVPPTPSYFKPMSHKAIIRFLLEEFGKCFDDDKNRYKQDELRILAEIVSA